MQQNRIHLRVAGRSAACRQALGLFGVPSEKVELRVPPTRPLYRYLKPKFLAGRLPGQIESVHRDRHSRPGKVLEFQLAELDGFVRVEPQPGLTLWHCRLLIRLGVAVEA